MWETVEMETIPLIPDGIKKWNWGAFLIPWLWGIGNKSYKALYCFIPLFNIYWAFICGIKGNEWAWTNNKWESIEQFHNTQKKWTIIILLLALILTFTAYFYD